MKILQNNTRYERSVMDGSEQLEIDVVLSFDDDKALKFNSEFAELLFKYMETK